MNIRMLVLACGAMFCAAANSAQQAPANLPPLYRGVTTHVDGLFVTPVAGAPFSGTVMIKTEVILPDGATQTRYTVNTIARDSSGRIHNERRRLVTDAFHGTPHLLQVHIFDPQTRVNTYYSPDTHVATQRVLPVPPAERREAHLGATTKDLGASQLNGVQARGIRYAYTVAADLSGTGKAIEVSDEYWYSDDLHMNVLITHNDPRTGFQTVALTQVDRGEPSAALFQVPAEYKIVDMNPPPTSEQR